MKPSFYLINFGNPNRTHRYNPRGSQGIEDITVTIDSSCTRGAIAFGGSGETHTCHTESDYRGYSGELFED